MGQQGLEQATHVAHEQTINQLSKNVSFRNVNVSILSAVAALASVKDIVFQKKALLKNQIIKEWLEAELKKLDVKFVQSQTNFLFIYLGASKNKVFKALNDKNILFSTWPKEKGGWIRVTIGKGSEMKFFIEILKQSINQI